MRPDFAVTVIIPTLGLRERALSLTEAIRSALDQAGVTTTVIVMLKGPERDPKIERALRDNMGVTLVVRDERGLPSALAVARAMVQTPWFATLDDDDCISRAADHRSRNRRRRSTTPAIRGLRRTRLQRGRIDALRLRGRRWKKCPISMPSRTSITSAVRSARSGARRRHSRVPRTDTGAAVARIESRVGAGRARIRAH
jgi:hypothetical protein